MRDEAADTFGALLLRYRKAAALTQEELAERAGLSARAISDLERGVKHTPRKDTLLLLADALALAPAARTAFTAAARAPLAPAPAPPDATSAASALPPDPPESPPRHNLPAQLTPLLGREAEVAALTTLLTDTTVRLVTCTGTGGTGKTRLALAAAAALCPTFADGVYFVDLAPLRDPALVTSTIVATLGVKESGSRPLLAQLQEALRARRLLLVLDNYEHLLASAPVVTDLLAAAPQVKMLVTSRTVLRLYGEHEFPVPPLPLDDIFPDGVHFVDLADQATAAQVATALAVALRVREVPGRPLAEQLAGHLQVRRLLLVVENLPPEAPGAAVLAGLGAPAPGVAILGLDAGGLQVYQAGAGDLAANGAVALFVARARAAQAGWVATEAHLLVAAAIAARLDGLPLAIELAAARSRDFAPGALLRRLDARLSVLTGRMRDRPARHQTLRALIGWSYDLLDWPAQLVLARLAVFAGGCTIDAAAAVCSSATVPAVGIADQLAELAEQSLVRTGGGPAGEQRYEVLDTIREYAAERLAETGEQGTTGARHLAYYLELAETTDPALRSGAQLDGLARLDAEHANLQAALREAREPGRAEAGLRLAAALSWYWLIRGYWSEGLAALARVLTTAQGAPAEAGTRARMRALLGAANLATRRGEYAEMRVWGEEALEIATTQGDRHGRAEALYNSASSAFLAGTAGKREALLREALALYRAEGDVWGEAAALFQLGGAAYTRADPAGAQRLWEQSRALYAQVCDRRGQALALDTMNNIAYEQGDFARLRANASRSLELWRALGDRWGMGLALGWLGLAAQELGDFAAARAYHEHVRTLCAATGAKYWLINALLNLADTLHCLDDLADAHALLTEALAGARTLADGQSLVAEALLGLGYMALAGGDLAAAADDFQNSLRLWPGQVADTREVRGCLAGLAAVALAAGDPARAVRLLAAAHAGQTPGSGPLLRRAHQGVYERTLAATRATLDPAVFTAVWAAGEQLTWERAAADVGGAPT